MEYTLRMLWTQRVPLLLRIFPEESRGQLVKLLPQRFFATTVELSAETIVLEQLAEVLLAQRSRKLNESAVVAEVLADCLDDVEDVLGRCALLSDRMELVTSDVAELGKEILVRGRVKVQPELPFFKTRRETLFVALGKRVSVEVAENVLEGGRFIFLELDGFLLAFLYTCVSFCSANSS